MKKLYFIMILTSILFTACQNTPKETKLNQYADSLSIEQLQSVDEFVSHNLLEGRAPGTRGGQLVEEYIKSLCKLYGLQSNEAKNYLQPFDMKGFTTKKIEAEANEVKLNYLDDIVGTYTSEIENNELEGKLVFVGFGVKSKLWNWDDYKDVDVKGKIVVTRVNDPGFIHPDIFEGKTLTYFGRWTYHIEEAARRGAAGILLIHTTESAGYNWNVVRNSWSGEELYINSDLKNKLKFRAWITEKSLRKILETNNIDLDKLYKQSESRDFKPLETGISFHAKVKNSFRKLQCNNVIAEIPGKVKQRIVISAHIDHLGSARGKEGDSIYNGAIDNGSAVAALMLTTKILKENQDKLHYSITILACNAEESGLLGSKFYAENTKRDEIVANINFESTPVWKKAKSIMGIGARFSELEDMIKANAKKQGLGYSQFSLSNQGLFYRSDQFSFARYGIPAVWISAGEDEEDGEINYTKFWSTAYHTVDDEYNSQWPMEGMKQTIKHALMLIEDINAKKSAIKWKENLPFKMQK